MKGVASIGWIVAIILLATICPVESAETPGSVDTSFDPGRLEADISYLVPGQGKVIGLALGPKGEIYIGGHFTDFLRLDPFEIKDWNGLARLKEDGSLDETFSVPVFEMGNHIDAHDIFVERDGTVWVGFNLYSPVRYLSDGTAFPLGTNYQSSFGIGGIYPDGRFLEWNLFGQTVERKLADGSLDTDFVAFVGYQLDERVILSDERILAPDRRLVASQTAPSGFLNRLNADGSLDDSYQRPNFTTNGIATITGFLESPKGQVYVSGNFEEVNGKPFARLVRLNENGTLDESFRPDPSLTSTNSPRINSMALQPNGKLLVALHAVIGEPGLRGTLVRLNRDGSLDNSFDPGTGPAEGNDGPQFPAYIGKVVVQHDGKILAAGDFTRFNGIVRDGVVRLHGDPVEPLRIKTINVGADGGVTLGVTGTAEVVEVQVTEGLGGTWQSVGTVEIDLVDSGATATIELRGGAASNRFFQVQRR